jgi:hypothetical protein
LSIQNQKDSVKPKRREELILEELKKQDVFRSFYIPKPFVSKKDIFCLRFNRRADGYRNISLKTLNLKVNRLNPYDHVEVRIYKLNRLTTELRFWRNNSLLDVHIIKNSFLKAIHF